MSYFTAKLIEIYFITKYKVLVIYAIDCSMTQNTNRVPNKILPIELHTTLFATAATEV